VNKKIIYSISFLVLCIVLFIIFFVINPKASKEEVKDDSEQIPEYIQLKEEKIKDENIYSEIPEYGDMIGKIFFNGEVASDPDKMIQLSPKINGIIKKVNFVPGTIIAKDAILIEIESLEASKLRSKYISSQSKYQALNKNVLRMKELWNIRMVGEQELINAETDLKIAESEWISDASNLNTLGISIPGTKGNDSSNSKIYIRSPMKGIAISRNAIPGSQVDPNQSLGIIADLSEVWFMIKIYEKELSKVKEGQKVRIELNSYPGEFFNGELNYIGSIVDSTSRFVEGRIVLQNQNFKARVGLFGKAELDVVHDKILSINRKSIVKYNNSNFVFIEKENRMFYIKEIQIGMNISEKVQILEGIGFDDKIVTSGIYYLKARFFKSTFGED
jgi:membrane fusion protein, heavy metal efflux system